MRLHDLMARDLRVHLVVDGVQGCPAPADGLTQTTEPAWATCAACLAGLERLRAAVAAELRPAS